MLSTIVDAFLMNLESEGRTPQTVQWYRESLAQLVKWIRSEGHPQDPGNWDVNTIRFYLVHLRNRTKLDGTPLAGATIAGYARSLRGFCRWLHEEEFTEAHLLTRVKLPTAPKVIKSTFTIDECLKLIAAAKESHNPVRDEAILLFMLDSGVRANELCTLQTADIDWSQRLAKVSGKGRKQRFVPFSALTAKVMIRYSAKSRNTTCGGFFQTDEGTDMTLSAHRHIVRRISERAGVKANPHKFRHTFAITFLRNGGNV
ncbi:MAG: tyrosine-type recombinase/integrase, partial [Thermomicrobiales bacterium]